MISEAIITRAHMFYRMGIDTFDAYTWRQRGSVGAAFLTTDETLVRHINKNDDTIFSLQQTIL